MLLAEMTAMASYTSTALEVFALGLVGAVVFLWAVPMVISTLLCAIHPVTRPKPGKIPEGKDGVYFIGHASTLIILDGIRILVDPNWSDHMGYLVRRFILPPIAIKDLGRIDLICLTHWHNDHYDRRTMRQFDRKIPVMAPASTHRSLRRNGFKNLREAGKYQGLRFDKVTVTPVPCEHRSAPDGVGFVFSGSTTIYHTGDTALNGMMFRTIAENFKIDLALLPIGAYRGMPPMGWVIDFNTVHMSPDDAVQAFELLEAKQAAAIHHGVFRIMAEPADEAGKRLQALIEQNGLQDKFLLPEVGEFVEVNMQRS